MLRKLLFFALIAVLIMTQASPAVAAAYADIATNWARAAITELEERGVFADIFEEEYGPHQPLDTATFRTIVERAFELDEPISLDSDDHELVTRALLVSTAAKALGIGPHSISLADAYPSFEDVDKDNPVFLEVEVLHSLNVLPTYIHNRFEPERPATRSEIAHLISKVSTWQSLTGKITEVAEDAAQIMVQTDTDLFPLTLTAQTTVFSGGRAASRAELKAGTVVFALYDDTGEAVLVSEPQRGLAALVDPDAVMGFLNKTAQVLTEVLTPEQVSAVLNGDWQALSDEVRYELHQRLVDLGVSPWEVDALLEQDWTTVQEIAKDRLAAEAAGFLNVSPELVFAALNRNWERLVEYAQVELAQRLLTSDWLKNAN